MMAASSSKSEGILARIERISEEARDSQASTDEVFQDRNALFIQAYKMKVPIAHIARAAGIGDSAVRCVVKGRGK